MGRIVPNWYSWYITCVYCPNSTLARYRMDMAKFRSTANARQGQFMIDTPCPQRLNSAQDFPELCSQTYSGEPVLKQCTVTVYSCIIREDRWNCCTDEDFARKPGPAEGVCFCPQAITQRPNGTQQWGAPLTLGAHAQRGLRYDMKTKCHLAQPRSDPLALRTLKAPEVAKQGLSLELAGKRQSIKKLPSLPSRLIK